MPSLFEDPGTDIPTQARQGKIKKDVSDGIMFDLDAQGNFIKWKGNNAQEQQEKKDSWNRIKDLDEDDVMGLAGFFPRQGKQSPAVQKLQFCDSDNLGGLLAKRFSQGGKAWDYPRNVWVCCCCPL